MQHLRNALGFVDLQGQVRYWLEQPDEVKRLAAIAVDIVAGHVPGDDDDRGASLTGQRDARQEIDRPWPGGRNAYGRLARRPRVAVGHEGRAFFVPGIDKTDIASAIHLRHNAVGGRTDDAKGV